MGRHFAIAIGINQYQFFQPLNYAQQDAEAFCDFWIDQANIPPQQSILLSDTSLPLAGRSTYPTREVLQDWIDKISGQGQIDQINIEPADQLWLLFSGYGVSHEGHDYLMPVDGDPNDVERTAISMRSLFTTLKNAPTDNLLVLLDINRAASLQSGSLLGAETVKLARELEIPVLLSCQPGQFSQETSDLRHGLFTAALLEALQSGECSTLANLDDYLQRRLPQLSDQHMRPPQTPLMVVNPPGKIHQVLLPQGPMSPEVPGTRPASEDPAASPQPPKPAATEEDDRFWQGLIFWTGSLAVLLLAGVFFFNREVFTGTSPNVTPGATQAPTSPTSPQAVQPGTPVPPPATSTPQAVQPGTPAPQPVQPKPPSPAPVTKPPAPALSSQERLAQARVAIVGNRASDYVQAIATARQIPANDPLAPQAQQAIDRWSQSILDIAIGRAQLGAYNEAIAAAKLVPSDRPETYGRAQELIGTWQTQNQQNQANQQILNQAINQVRPGQASSYNQAIAQVRKIPANQPGYTEAQKLTDQWSKDILQIAYGRASRKQFDAAIKTAALVPANTAAYQNAQQAIAKWKTQIPKP